MARAWSYEFAAVKTLTGLVFSSRAYFDRAISTLGDGEEVIVTDRGKPIAKIVPIKRADAEIPSHLLTLERAGLARIGKSALSVDFWTLPRPKDKKGLALQNLLREREEGR